jgi:GNAT superfamily N-acetyltransferase
VTVVRTGSLADVDLVAGLHLRSRQHAYRGLIAGELLDALDPAEFAVTWRAKLAVATQLFIAEEDGDAAGFAFVGDGTLHAIHVLPRWHGTGTGQALMRAAREGLRELGFDRAALWVLAQNERARRFYEKDGWVASGQTRQSDVNGALTDQLEYVADLAG